MDGGGYCAGIVSIFFLFVDSYRLLADQRGRSKIELVLTRLQSCRHRRCIPLHSQLGTICGRRRKEKRHCINDLNYCQELV